MIQYFDPTKRVVHITYGDTKIKAVMPTSEVNKLDMIKHRQSYTSYYTALLKRFGLKFDSNNRVPITVKVVLYEYPVQ